MGREKREREKWREKGERRGGRGEGGEERGGGRGGEWSELKLAESLEFIKNDYLMN